MSRVYTEISKESFLGKVKKLMDNEDFPYELPKVIESDLSKVRFDWENHTRFNDRHPFASHPVGYKEIAPGFHVFFANAGGEWEFPICYIFYWGNGSLRAYIPKDGNTWNKKEKCAYGSEENSEPINTDDEYERIEAELSIEKMINEILEHIIKK